MHVDLAHLDQLFQNDRALRNEWIELYLQETPQYFEQLSEAQRRGDVQAMTHAAHDLKPQAVYLGCTRMHALLSTIEEHAGTRGALACEDAIAELAALRPVIADELRTFIQRA